MSNSSRLKARYDKRVKWDLMQSFPERTSPEQVPTLKRVDLHCSLREVGMGSEALSAAWVLLSMVCGNLHLPTIHQSSVSVASFRLREGEFTGVSMSLTGPVVWDFMDGFLFRVVPRFRPFDGFPLECIDDAGNMTCKVVNPLGFAEVESYYERFHPRASRPGVTMTIHTNATTVKDKSDLSVEGVQINELSLQDRSCRLRGIHLLSGLGIPRME